LGRSTRTWPATGAASASFSAAAAACPGPPGDALGEPDGEVAGVEVGPSETGSFAVAVAWVGWASSAEIDGMTSPPITRNVMSHATKTPPTNPSLPITAPRYLNKSPTNN
jgi:hypothetical protein